MIFQKSMITPKKEDICQVQQTFFNGGRNIMVYSYTQDKKDNYLSHIYHIDDQQNGKEFIYDPQGGFVAEFPLYEGKANGKGSVCYQPGLQTEQYFYYGEVFPPLCNGHIVDTEGDPVVIELSAGLSLFDKATLTQQRLPDYILNFKEKQVDAQLVFRPVFKNTVIREASARQHE